MVKKSVAEQPQKSKLVVSREKLKETLLLRIEAGKTLLSFEVPTQVQNTFGYGFGYGRELIVYDEEKKEEFFNNHRKWNSFNKEVLKQSFDDPNNEYLRDYENCTPLPFITSDTDIVAEQKDDIKKQISNIEGLIERLPLIPLADGVENRQPKTEKKELTNKVFIVHGHNEEMKQSVARALSKLGLDPIILHERENAGRTIIEKFQENAEEIGFAVILLSNDDLGLSKRNLKEGANLETLLKPRTRQNVIFEMGYFIGNLGRSKVFLLIQEGVEKPGDLDGLVYTLYDAQGIWRFSLVRELKGAGYEVDANAIVDNF